MSLFIYYSKGTGHKRSDDVAVTRASNLKRAIRKFSVYYTNVSSRQVRKIDIDKKDVILISGY